MNQLKKKFAIALVAIVSVGLSAALLLAPGISIASCGVKGC
jgi:hypothetical protein